MTRYQKHMQHIHSIGQAMHIENAVMLVVEDIIDHLIKSGIKQDSKLIKDVRELSKYVYDPESIKKTYGIQSSNPKP